VVPEVPLLRPPKEKIDAVLVCKEWLIDLILWKVDDDDCSGGESVMIDSSVAWLTTCLRSEREFVTLRMILTMTKRVEAKRMAMKRSIQA
jgi:hypothetical protein